MNKAEEKTALEQHQVLFLCIQPVTSHISTHWSFYAGIVLIYDYQPCKVFTTIINQRGLKSNRKKSARKTKPEKVKTTEKRPPHQLSLSHIPFSRLLIFGEPKSYKVFSSTKSHAIWMCIFMCVCAFFVCGQTFEISSKVVRDFFALLSRPSFANMWNLFTKIGSSDIWTMEDLCVLFSPVVIRFRWPLALFLFLLLLLLLS